MSILKSISAACLGLAVVATPLAIPTKANAEEVYVIRGFLNVFSAGMNQMTAKLKARGVKAKAYSNGAWDGLANDIIKRHKQGKVSFPIVIMGHSVGGQEAPKMSNKLTKAGVPVKLVVGFDPGFAAPVPFSSGSPRVVNYWVAKGSRGNKYRGTGSFSGSISNIDIGAFSKADHVGIDKDPGVQSRAISLVLAAVGK